MTDVIKEFLVGLGFGVDDAGLAKFNKAIASATLKVTALYTATKATAAGIVYGISKISEGFEQMGYEYRIIAPAINKALMLRRELLKAYSLAGVSITKVVAASVRLNFSLSKTQFAFEALYKSVASRFFELITKQSDMFRKKLYENMPRIQAALEKFITFVFKAVEVLTQFGGRVFEILSTVWDFLVRLHQATDGWSTTILAVVAAWKLLNLAFLATPLGLIISGIVALIALYDDLMVFKEGGQSLFNWTEAIPVIEQITDAVKVLWEWGVKLTGIFGEFLRIVGGGISGAVAGIANTIAAISGPTVALPGGAGAGFFGQGAPLGVGGNTDNSTRQNVSQQTNINVQSSADANAVGKSIAGEQSRVNFDMTRNLKGATR